MYSLYLNEWNGIIKPCLSFTEEFTVIIFKDLILKSMPFSILMLTIPQIIYDKKHDFPDYPFDFLNPINFDCECKESACFLLLLSLQGCKKKTCKLLPLLLLGVMHIIDAYLYTSFHSFIAVVVDFLFPAQ